MTTNQLKNNLPTVATHPGILLHDEIEYRGISQQELAAWMKIEVTLLRVIIDGEKSMDAYFALALEKTLGIDAYYWLRMQAKYDLDSLRIKEAVNGSELMDTLTGALSISSEPKSAYASLGKRFKTLE
jgi:addiction module HigA family antidote